MVMKMLIFILLFIYKNMFSEGRVHCEDSNASPWKPLGNSCPVNCASIIMAVERLKMNEYSNIFNNNNIQSTTPIVESKIVQLNKTREIRKIFNFVKTQSKETHLHLKGINMFYGIFKNEQVFKKIRTTFKLNTCPFLKKAALKPMQLKRLDKKCFRRYNRDDFLKTFTQVLNKYTHSEYQFTEEMTAMLLQKILGKNMDLRHGIFDVTKIIAKIGEAIRNHEEHIRRDLIIELKSKHCLTVFISGCLCRPGFVESSGQCVMPSDCFPNTLHSEYLARIVVH